MNSDSTTSLPGALPNGTKAIRRQLTIFFALCVAVALVYVLITGHVWEDFLIKFRHSRNLVNGHGLVFTPGERVHGFTSAINTLLPALFAAGALAWGRRDARA